MEMSMTTLFIVWGSLFAAVVGRSMFDPWPADATDETPQPGMMETIARSIF
jgi:hypothetical protein